MSVISCRRVQSGYVTNSTQHFLPTTEVTLFLETHTEIKGDSSLFALGVLVK